MITRAPGRHRMTRQHSRSMGPKGLKYAHATGHDLPITEVAAEARVEGDGVGTAGHPPAGQLGMDVEAFPTLGFILCAMAILTGISLLFTAAAAAFLAALVPWG